MSETDNGFLPKLAAHIYDAAKGADDKAPSERELAEHYSISRGQVRESLAILESMGVIERRAKSGIYLRRSGTSLETMEFFARAGIPVQPSQIFEAVELRKIHEIKAAELAAERATAENFERLRDILNRSEQRIAQGQGLQQLDRDFHLEIVRATKNVLFHTVCTTFYAGSAERLPIYFAKAERNQKSHAEHMQIFDALFRRDAILAQALMNTHLGGAQSYWTEILETEAPVWGAAS